MAVNCVITFDTFPRQDKTFEGVPVVCHFDYLKFLNICLSKDTKRVVGAGRGKRQVKNQASKIVTIHRLAISMENEGR